MFINLKTESKHFVTMSESTPSETEFYPAISFRGSSCLGRCWRINGSILLAKSSEAYAADNIEVDTILFLFTLLADAALINILLSYILLQAFTISGSV